MSWASTSDSRQTGLTIFNRFRVAIVLWDNRKLVARGLDITFGGSSPNCPSGGLIGSTEFQSIAQAASWPRTELLPDRNVVFVVDDDPGMLRGVSATAAAIRLRQLAVSVCGGFRKPQRFRRGSLRPSRHQPGRWFRHRVEAPSQGGWQFCAGHLHDWERQPRRSRGCASIRMSRLSHKAVLGEVADGAARESLGGVGITLRGSDCAYVGSVISKVQPFELVSVSRRSPP